MEENRRGALTKFGKALHFSQVTGNIIAKVKEPTEPGSIVVDEKLRKIGTVIEVFGPVASPYAAIKPFDKANSAIVDRLLYTFRDQSNPKRKRKFR